MVMIKHIIFLFIFVVLLQGCSQKNDPPSEIIGKWQLVSLSIHGKLWSQKDGKESVTTFSEDRKFEIQVGDTVAGEGTYTLDGFKLDMIFEATTNRPTITVKYIFSTENDSLNLCNLENGLRPTHFNLTTNSIVQVLKKMKKGSTRGID